MFRILVYAWFAVSLLAIASCATRNLETTHSLLGHWDLKRLAYDKNDGVDFENEWWFIIKKTEITEHLGPKLANHYDYSRNNDRIMIRSSGIHQNWQILSLTADELVIDTHFWVYHLIRVE